MKDRMQQYSRKNAWTMLLLVVMAFCIHLRWLNRIPLTEDEETSIDIATGMGFRYENPQYAHIVQPLPQAHFTSADYWKYNDAGHVTTYTIADNGNNYGYNLLLHYWICIAGFSVFKIRLLSVLCTVLTALLLYRLAVRIANSYTAGVIAAVLFLLHPLVIIYSHIARSYALSLPLICVSIWLVYLLAGNGTISTRRHRWYYVAFTIVSVMMVLAHYFNTVIVVYNLAALLLFNRKKENLLPVFISGIMILLPVTGWLFISGTGLGLVQNFQSHVYAHAGQLPWLPEAKPATTMWAMLAMLTASFGNATLPDMGLKMWINISLLILPAILLFYAFKRTVTAQRPFIRYLLLMIPAFVLFAISIAVISGHLFICQFRFWIFIIPFIMLLLAYAIRKTAFTSSNWYLLQAAAILIILRAVFTGFTFVTDMTVSLEKGRMGIVHAGTGYAGEPYEKAASVIKQKYKPGYVVVYGNWRIAQNMNWFLAGRNDMAQQTDLQSAHLLALRDADGNIAWSFDSFGHENITGPN